jgi:hypothetical protein
VLSEETTVLELELVETVGEVVLLSA